MRRVLAPLCLVASTGCSLLLGEGLSGADDPNPVTDGGTSGEAADGGAPGEGDAQTAMGEGGGPGGVTNVPVVIDTRLDVSDVAADESGVYWVDTNSGDVRGAAPDGSNLRTLCRGKGAPQTLALDEQNVLWGEAGQDRIQSIAKTAIEGTPTFVTVEAPRFVARGGTDVYSYDNVTAKVYRTTTSLVPPALVVDLAAAGEKPGNVAGLSADETGVFVAIAGNTNRVRRFPRLGGTGTDATPKVGELSSCAIDGARVYVASSSDGVVRSNAIAGGGDLLHASGLGAPVDVAVDATDVYWTDATGKVYRAPKAGGPPPLVIAQGQISPGPIAVNSRAIYWVNEKKTVVMLKKP